MLVKSSTRAYVGTVMASFLVKYALSFTATPNSMIGFNMTGVTAFFRDAQGDFEDECTGHDVWGIVERLLVSIGLSLYLYASRVPTNQVLFLLFVFLLSDYLLAKDQFKDCLFGFLP